MKPVSLHWQEGRTEESEPDVSMGAMQVPVLQPPHSESSRALCDMLLVGDGKAESICADCVAESYVVLWAVAAGSKM